MEFLAYSLVWCLAVFGATNILTVGAIFHPLRQFIEFKRDKTPRRFHWPAKLLKCPMCISFWVAIFFSLTVWSPASDYEFRAEYHNYFCELAFNGFLGSITSWIGYLMIANKQFNK